MLFTAPKKPLLVLLFDIGFPLVAALLYLTTVACYLYTNTLDFPDCDPLSQLVLVQEECATTWTDLRRGSAEIGDASWMVLITLSEQTPESIATLRSSMKRLRLVRSLTLIPDLQVRIFEIVKSDAP